MKKVVGIFMILVLVFIVGSMAFGEDVMKASGGEVYGYVREWLDIYDKDEVYINGGLKDGIMYDYGVLIVNEIPEFEEIYCDGFDVEKCMYELLDEYYGIVDFEFRMVGEYEGYPVYKMRATTIKPSGSTWIDDELVEFYGGDIIFMLCDER